MREEAKSFLPLSPATLHILLSLAGEELHGYAIMQEVQRQSEGKYKLGPGTLYDNLQKMIDKRLVEELGKKPGDDEYGEEIVVSRSVAVDLSGHAAGTTLYVAVRYDERPERPVPTPMGQQHTRIRETFAVEVLIRLPRQKPLVVLADVELGRGGKVMNIGTARRRYVGD